MRYTAIEDECKVSVIEFILYILFIIYFCMQTRKDQWGKTTITYTTDRPSRLPIIDIILRDFNEVGQSFSIHLGPVCYV